MSDSENNAFYRTTVANVNQLTRAGKNDTSLRCNIYTAKSTNGHVRKQLRMQSQL